ncbi:MAG: (2Fe-2S)-binding protein [Deltaproteobacteria bacterium]|nr:(2Fe-2S)-binding protein [Deltaproteobacteria bacterium]
MTTIAFSLNGRAVQAEVEAGTRLIDLLRESFDCTEVKEGCGEGECGACTVLLDGRPVTSCVLFAWQAHGRTVVTVAGLPKQELSRIQEAMVGQGAVQCGFCTPGFVLSIKALLDSNPTPTRGEILAAVSGNLCRCTGYERIARAVEQLTRQGGSPCAP